MNRYIIIALATLGILVSCQKAEVEEYAHDNGVYFQLFDTWSNKADTINYNFVKNDLVEAPISVRVNLQGVPKGFDRKFVLKVNVEKSTAREGVDFKALETEYIIASNEYYTIVPVYLKRSETLKTETLILTLALEETEDLVLGFYDRQRAVIKFTDRLTEPYYWQNILSMWGPYSQIKQITIEQVTGYEFPETEEEYMETSFYTIMSVASNYMNKWFGENEVIDENGQKIVPWK